ncbi:50S ribosomal protein L11 methyltransferase [Pelotomaculum propionicicum]|uniref:50S ribosomal protein L11 methyltransferase n=1 Tax=Pelotomaculum propionicicum TaxID=258475 RepID=UPI003B7C671D
MEWLEIAVRTPADGVEPVSEIFIEMGAGGVVIEDPALILQYERKTHPDEWAVSEQPEENGLSLVKAYLPLEDGWPGRVEEIRSLVSQLGLAPMPEIATRAVAEEDWAEAWKKYYKTVRVGRRLVIKPSWEEYQPLEGDLVIEMDPGMAFGCGTHATTALCLTLLEKYVRTGITVYDIGTGSGILAVAAARLGAGRVYAVDLDPVACKTAAENVERNNAGGVVSVRQGNLAELLENGADLVVANIIADVIAGFAPQAAAILKPGGVFIASGIIREKADMVRRALEAAGLSVCEDLEDGLWIALVARKES